MEGSFLSNVPPPDKGRRKASTEEVKRVRVYRNGEKIKNRCDFCAGVLSTVFIALFIPSLSPQCRLEKENIVKTSCLFFPIAN